MLKAALLITCLAVALPGNADTLIIPIGQQTPVSQPLPQRGQSQAEVLQLHGQPERQLSVGEPAITRWFYPEFSVYFEGQHVIHSVTHFKPQYPK